jgi:hypothetical protein
MASPARSSLVVGAKSYDALKLSSQIDSFQDLIYWRRSVETGGSEVKTKLAVLGGCVGLLMAGLPLLAHHSFAAEYDNSKPVSVKGKAIKMDWVNPHSHLIFEVTTPEGKTEKWVAETPPPNGLYRAGWRQTMIKGGEEITVNGYLAKDGDNLMWAQSVDFADGRRITLNSSPEPQKDGGRGGRGGGNPQ